MTAPSIQACCFQQPQDMQQGVFGAYVPFLCVYCKARQWYHAHLVHAAPPSLDHQGPMAH